MWTISERNVQQVLPVAMEMIHMYGVTSDSRNGPVLVLPEPLTTVYERPRERVLFHEERDANPFFHLLESLWMLAGRNDLEFVAGLVPSMANYSDDGRTLNGAYGHRWRHHFGIDQLLWAVEELSGDPTSRRVVVSMWDGAHDPGLGSKDLPCNISLHLRVNHKGELDMTVFNRSNDLWFGAYGANAVHFSVLQEFVASALGREVGRYWQVSDNWHLYTELYKSERIADRPDPYAQGEVTPYPLVKGDHKTWLQELDIFLESGGVMPLGTKEPFFRKVAAPFWGAYRAFKEEEGIMKYERPLEILQSCAATDWRRAGEEWIVRRYNKWRNQKV